MFDKYDSFVRAACFVLTLGDPTVFGNFNVDQTANDAVYKQLNTFKHNGYSPAHGIYFFYL